MNNEGYNFLNKIYQDLHLSDEVMHTATPSDTKNVKIAKYMDRLGRVTRKAFDENRPTRENDIAMIKKLYHDRYVITHDDVPESYFELQKKIALERGMGHLEYTENVRNQEIEHIISEQEASLDSWIEYFASPDTDNYPTWFKYYAFQGMLKLGTYDKERGSFNRRTSRTVKPFIELDREALALVYDVLAKAMSKEQIEDEELEKLINNGSFGKLYGYALKKMEEAKKDISSDDGIWKKYPQGSNPEILYNDIHGKGTGWCTAGGLETATEHVNGGDFYVYFTKGSDGEYSQPRIAIRKSGLKIAEIRGIGPDQNLESNMERVVERKLQEEEFPDRDEYKRKVEDMQMMTYIYTKWQNKGELTKGDLSFLYEIDSEIIGFGWKKDPRIKEILNGRSKRKDLAIIFNCDEKQISTTKEEALSGGIIYHHGDLYLRGLTTAEGLQLPKRIGGFLNLSSLITAKNLQLPERIEGFLDLRGLTTAEGLQLPKYVGGYLDLSKLTTAKGLDLPEHIGGGLDLRGLTTAEGLELPEHVEGDLYLNGLTTAEGLELPEHVGENLDLSGLTTAEGLQLPKHIGESLYLGSLTTAKGLQLPEHIGRDLDLSGLTTAEGLQLPERIEGSLNLGSLTTTEGLELPEHIGGSLNLSGLTTAEDLQLPGYIGSLDLSGLTTAEGLKLPKRIEGSLYLDSLTTAKGLELPEHVGGNLSLGLTTAEGLKLPNYIGGSLDLSLTTAEGLQLPEHIEGWLDLGNLTTAEGLKLPRYIGGWLNLSNLTTAKGLELPEHINNGFLMLNSLKSFEGAILPHTEEGREQLLQAIKNDGNLPSLIMSLEQEYANNPLEVPVEDINESNHHHLI